MPLPDATPDKRIYELLKTVDLENLTFDDLQAVGQTIFAEQGAEDELRRLILLNLARLSVVGEWTGLTSAGGGVGYPNNFWQPNGWTPNAAGYGKFNDYFSQLPVTGRSRGTTLSEYNTFYFGWPIQVNVNGSYTTIAYNVAAPNAGEQLDCAIYSVDDYARPLTKIGTMTLSVATSAGYQTTSVTETTAGSMTLSKGDTLWVFVKNTGATGNGQITTEWHEFATLKLGTLDVAGTGSTYNCLIMNSLPSTVAESDIIGVGTLDLVELGAVVN